MQAAERRIRDEKSCASGPEAQREAEKATKESEVIDLTLDDNEDDLIYNFDSDSDVVIVVEDNHRKPPSSSAIATGPPPPPPPPPVPQRRPNPSGSSSSNANKPRINYDTKPSSKTPIRKTNPRPPSQVEWSCQACTLLNPYISLRCEVCNMHRPF